MIEEMTVISTDIAHISPPVRNWTTLLKYLNYLNDGDVFLGPVCLTNCDILYLDSRTLTINSNMEEI